jgi:hypothetical protein
MKILITGGLGKSIQKIVNINSTLNDFIFLSRNDCDLRFKISKSSRYHIIVIHLASCVGGVYDNMSKNYTYM